MTAPALTVLSFGGGQDSTAILYKLALDADWRRRYAPGRLLVVMADTGDEDPETYAHVERVRWFCAEHGIEFDFLTADRDFHRGYWKTLRGYFETRNTIQSACFPKACTDNLKIQPIYRFLNDWVGREYRLPTIRKAALKTFAARHGKIRVLIGIARGEESRVSERTPRQKWMAQSIERVYPLIEAGMDRADCQSWIASTGHPVPPPSACQMCPFKSGPELLWMERNRAAAIDLWIALESRKLAHFAHKGDQNMGVFGRKTIVDKLAEAREKFGHLTPAELDRERMTHGHCVATSY